MDRNLIRKVAWLSDDYTSSPIRAVIVNFHGLGHNEMKKAPSAEEYEWATAGGLTIFPYYGPWSWMNREARQFVDDLIDAVLREKDLPGSTPIFSIGDSMGGCSALLFARYSRHRVAAVSALYPVCDLKFHYSERSDVARTLHSAFRSYSDPFDSIIEEHCPLAQVQHMPDIPYLVIHGENDKSVSKAAHSDIFVKLLLSAGRTVEYIEALDLPHGGPFTQKVVQRRIAFFVEKLLEIK